MLYRITSATSRITTAADDHAFQDNTVPADTLIVNEGAFLIAKGATAAGALLAAPNLWTVTINGSVVSQQYVGLRTSAPIIITVGVNGEIGGDTIGIESLGTQTTIKNLGIIAGTDDTGGIGIFLSGGGTQTITNQGVIEGSQFAFQDSTNGNTTINNSGLMNGNVETGFGNDTVTNSGEIAGFLQAFGTFKLINSGLIEQINLEGDSNITNSGTIFSMALGDGLNTVNNSGRLGEINGGTGTDRIINWGIIDYGTVKTFEGNDVFTNFKIVGGVLRSGTVLGTVDLGTGDDAYNGGANADQFQDNDGADTAKFGAGNDTYVATYVPPGVRADGNDTLDGGKGSDTYDASDSTLAVLINLDTINQPFLPFTGGLGILSANTAQGNEVSGPGLKDSVFNFENVIGGVGEDVIYGSAAANRLEGGGGNDFLYSFGGNDELLGGASDDFLFGGSGKDISTGGTGTDTFFYQAASDSGITGTTRDVIKDLEAADIIDLEQIDANTTLDDNNQFDFIGTNVLFSGTAGELRAYWTANGQIIEGDVNGDAIADFSIKIEDSNHLITLSAGDFNL